MMSDPVHTRTWYAASCGSVAASSHGPRYAETYLRGRLVGNNSFGNRYYAEKSQCRGTLRAHRWAVYAGPKEASAVPAEWHGWLQYTIDAPLPETGKHPRQKPYLPNATGTASGYRPTGHDYRGGHRAAADGDYEPRTSGG